MVTKEQAMTLTTFYHVSVRYQGTKNRGAYQCRANGKCQTWKRDETRFRLPVKIGFKGHDEITNDTARHWLALDPTNHDALCATAKLDKDTPSYVLADRLTEMGYGDVAEVYLNERALIEMV